jgi:hypothetical protein
MSIGSITASSSSSSSSESMSSTFSTTAAQNYRTIYQVNCKQCNYMTTQASEGLPWERVESICRQTSIFEREFTNLDTGKKYVFGDGVHVLRFDGNEVIDESTEKHEHFYKKCQLTICNKCMMSFSHQPREGMCWPVNYASLREPKREVYTTQTDGRKFEFGDGVYELQFNGADVITLSEKEHNHAGVLAEMMARLKIKHIKTPMIWKETNHLSSSFLLTLYKPKMPLVSSSSSSSSSCSSSSSSSSSSFSFSHGSISDKALGAVTKLAPLTKLDLNIGEMTEEWRKSLAELNPTPPSKIPSSTSMSSTETVGPNVSLSQRLITVCSRCDILGDSSFGAWEGVQCKIEGKGIYTFDVVKLNKTYRIDTQGVFCLTFNGSEITISRKEHRHTK